MSPSSYRPDIDGLRSIAVISVLLFHLDVQGFSGGFVGVDVFFVISGFLITNLIANAYERDGRFDFPLFYLRRLRRLGPAMLFTFFLTTIVSIFLFAPHDFRRYGGELFHAILSLSNIFFWLQSGYFDAVSELSPLLHTWSLSVEEQFYLLWPVSLVFFLTKGGRRLAALSTVGILLISFLLNLIFDPYVLHTAIPELSNDTSESLKDALFFLTPFRIFELAIGAILCFIMARRIDWKYADETLFALGIFLIGYAVLTYDNEIVFPSYNAVAPCLGAALIIYANDPRHLGLLLRNPIAVYIGKISYSLYLVHWPIIVFYKYWKLEELVSIEKIVIFAASLLLAAFMFAFIEQPFRKPAGSIPHRVRDRRFAVVMGAMAVALLATIGNSWLNEGWLWRLRPSVQSVYAGIGNAKDFGEAYYGGVDCQTRQRCVLNSRSGRNVYLVGDSHAKHYARGLKNAYPNVQFTFIDNRCRFNSLKYCYAQRSNNPRAFAQKIEQLVEMKNSGERVIVGQSWGSFREYYEPTTKSVIRFNTMKEYADFLIEGLQDVDAYLGPDRLIVMGEVNKFASFGDPLTCLGKPTGSKRCDYSMESYAVRLNRQLAAGLKKAGIDFINPTDTLCSQRGCRNFVNRMPIYSDSAHLSVWGSDFLVQNQRAQLDRALGITVSGPSVLTQ